MRIEYTYSRKCTYTYSTTQKFWEDKPKLNFNNKVIVHHYTWVAPVGGFQTSEEKQSAIDDKHYHEELITGLLK